MGVSTAGHLPGITSTTYPALAHCLQATQGALRKHAWSVTIRMFRSSLPTTSASSSASSSQLQMQQRDVRTMYIVQLSEFPEQSFVLIEDNARPTRAVVKGNLDAVRARNFHERKEPEKEAKEIGDNHTALSGNLDKLPASDEAQLDDKVRDAEGKGANEIVEATLAKSHDALPDESMEKSGKLEPILELSKTDDPASEAEVAPQLNTDGPTRQVLFSASSQYTLLLARLNLPPPLGVPTSGEGAVPAGPGAWLSRGAPIVIQGYTYDIPSASEAVVGGGGSDGAHAGEWRVRLGMVQSGGTRSSGAIVESEYLPLQHIADDAFLIAHLQSLFPLYLTDPALASGQQGPNASVIGAPGSAGVIAQVPLPSQWAEVVPASHEAWLDDVSSGSNESMAEIDSTPLSNSVPKHKRKRLQQHSSKLLAPHAASDTIGWQGTERGRRLAFLYITLLRNQGIL